MQQGIESKLTEMNTCTNVISSSSYHQDACSRQPEVHQVFGRKYSLYDTLLGLSQTQQAVTFKHDSETQCPVMTHT
jgi:hypothetical protein